ncbi:glycosyl transferase [Bernardetia litoralis DSM 6794]|uniref:Glycosyl transferase n=1 Tax=Bernardetia litoralis (strain ATCC 23117 / DSM 6794 / NBRC 15988 / NCIMB 1366 / Fx l1 / Sio-4) TaxID=880071 RepID=I4AJ22_BERLS|nr:glycosyltransferase family 2 protein [Bernardetia litoralis]AFM03957.1 glycosyl transferase [Bernardetia litoralis DSM 6794]
MPPLISIVSPVYRAEKIVDKLVERISNEVSKITENFEIILVEDGSPDNSWEAIERNCAKDKRVKGIKLSRNFGQHYAITAGLDAVKGEWVVVMDCDLQDRPEEIINLYTKALEGYDVVLASRHQRQDTFFKKLFSKLFYKVLSYLTGTEQDPTIANFGIYHNKVIQAISTMRESIRYFPTMVKWVGFRRIKINVEHASREEGTTSYNFKRLLNLALDIILAYSDRPIRLTIKTGFIISCISFLFAIITIVKYFLGSISVSGYASLIISIWFFSGLIMTTLGVVGLYVGKTFEGVKNRPIYITKKTIN